ncbi:hypothetical protein ACHAWF_017229 [Thalassiosira exigua]
MTMKSDSSSNRYLQRPSHITSICAAALFSSTPASAFAPSILTAQKSSLAPRSAVIQRYRVEDGSSDASQHQHQSDAFSLLPSRLSSIERMDNPSQFQARVLDEENSLVVVRFYADACPSCRATQPLFRKWSRDIERNDILSAASTPHQRNPISVKILEMPLTKATSSFLKDQLHVDRLPYCHLYHPQFGLVEEKLVMNKSDFDEFSQTVDGWSSGEFEEDLQHGKLDTCDGIELDSRGNDECAEFC